MPVRLICWYDRNTNEKIIEHLLYASTFLNALHLLLIYSFKMFVRQNVCPSLADTLVR